MNISRFEVNPFGEVTYILWDETSRQACIVDPGMMRDDERDMIENFLASHHLTLQFVLLSHIHIDHVTSA
ncbi:MAG: MBL fold metallo-hydrolase, partial [Muribaculaceae bacterium]|nr:MBL fold metallo-hydrolase [Muribaculaceae bacterium]